MPNPNKTHFVLILDRSGSMDSIRGDMLGGIQQFLKEQRDLPGEAALTFVRFDDHYEEVFADRPLKDAKIEEHDFVPRGRTALLDAMGKTISTIGARLAKLPEAERPSKVLVVTVTDGQENASREFAISDVKRMVEHQTQAYSWQFVFLGASLEAFNQHSGVGVAFGSALHSPNLRAAFAGTSKAAARFRGGDAYHYTSAERAAAATPSSK
jgi:hypothetical protein